MQAKILTISFPNGAVYEVPAKVLAEGLGTYWAEIDTGINDDFKHHICTAVDRALWGEFQRLKVIHTEQAYGDNMLLYDWLRNNVDWHDLKPHAKLVKLPAIREDYNAMFDEAGFEFNWGSPL